MTKGYYPGHTQEDYLLYIFPLLEVDPVLILEYFLVMWIPIKRCFFLHRVHPHTHTNVLHSQTFLPTLSRYIWNLFSTSLDRFVQLLLIFSISNRWLSQVRWKVWWWGNRPLIRSRKSLVTVWIPSRELAKSSLHFLVKRVWKKNLWM